MTIHASNKDKITKDEEYYLPHLEFNKIVLVHCNTVNNDYQQYLRVRYTFVLNKSFVLKIYIFKNI